MSRAVQFSSRIARLQSRHFYNTNVTRRITQHHPTSGLAGIISLKCINAIPKILEESLNYALIPLTRLNVSLLLLYECFWQQPVTIHDFNQEFHSSLICLF